MSIITKTTKRTGTTPATGREHGKVAPSTSIKLGTTTVKPKANKAPINPNLKISARAEDIRVYNGTVYQKEYNYINRDGQQPKAVATGKWTKADPYNYYTADVSKAQRWFDQDVNASLAKYGDMPAPWTEKGKTKTVQTKTTITDPQSPSPTVSEPLTTQMSTAVQKVKQKKGKGRLGTLLTQKSSMDKMATLLGKTSL